MYRFIHYAYKVIKKYDKINTYIIISAIFFLNTYIFMQYHPKDIIEMIIVLNSSDICDINIKKQTHLKS